MTLVEVLLAVVFLAAALAGIFGVLIQANRLTMMTRHRDSAMAILNSYADRFARIDPTLPDNTAFFAIGDTPTGNGLTWDTTWEPVTDEAFNAANGLAVYLGNEQSTRLKAHVFRTVQFVSKSDGTLSTVNPSPADEYCLVSATFSINYTFRNELKTQSLTVVREIPAP
ncbi:MAG TPA: hypothetical protein VFT72_03180 [Opitutaceae bacterium]|nr:hypothetical protein [Opitutaceae bacterium]